MIKRLSIIAGYTAFGMLVSTPNYGMNNDSNRASDTNQSFKDKLAMFNGSSKDNSETSTSQRPVRKLNMSAIQQQLSTSERPLTKEHSSIENLNKSGNGNVRNFLNNPGLTAKAARTGQSYPTEPSHPAVNDKPTEEEQGDQSLFKTAKVQRMSKSILDEYNSDDNSQITKEKSKDDFNLHKPRRAAPGRRKPTSLTGSSSDTTEHHVAQETKVTSDQPKMTTSISGSVPMNGQVTQKLENLPFEEGLTPTQTSFVISKAEFDNIVDRMLQGGETIDWSVVGNPCVEAFTVDSMKFSVISSLVKLFKLWIDLDKVTDNVILNYMGIFRRALNNYSGSLTGCFNEVIPACKTNGNDRTVAERFSDNIVWMTTDLWMKGKISGSVLKQAINLGYELQQGFIRPEVNNNFIDQAYRIVNREGWKETYPGVHK